MSKLFDKISKEALEQVEHLKPDLTKYIPTNDKPHASVSYSDRTGSHIFKTRYLIVNEENALEVHASLINYNLQLENAINSVLTDYKLQERDYRKVVSVGTTIGYCDIEVVRREELVS